MSQFSRKYYNLDYKRNEHPKRQVVEETVWEFWRVWGLFEYAAIALLLLILFCVCTQKSRVEHITTQKTVMVQTPMTSVSQDKEQQQTLGEVYPKKVLPESVLPKGVVTFEDYLYFADDTNSNYPDFIDPKTHRLIKKKAPKCHKLECPLQEGVSTESLHAYEQWVLKLSGEKLHLVRENGKYIFQKDN